MFIFHSFKAFHATLSHLHHQLPNSFNAEAISSLRLQEGKLYLGPFEAIFTNSRIRNDFQITSDNMASCWIHKFRILQSHECTLKPENNHMLRFIFLSKD